MAYFKITLTGQAPGSPDTLVFPEWGNRTFVYPTDAFDILPEFKKEEIRDSDSLRSFLDLGYLTADYNGTIITSSDQLITAIDGLNPDETIGLIIALG